MFECWEFYITLQDHQSNKTKYVSPKSNSFKIWVNVDSWPLDYRQTCKSQNKTKIEIV